MSDMFGAPAGISAAEQDIRQNLLAGVSAQKTLGEIAQQPLKMEELRADVALKQAHAKLYGAEAEAKTQAMEESKALAELARSGGLDSALDNTESLATPLLRLGKIAFGKGLLTKGVDLIKKGVDIATKEEQIASQQLLQEKRQLETQRMEAENDASMAASAVDQQSYDALRAARVAQKKDISGMPERYEDAKPGLNSVISQGMKAAETLRAKQATIDSEIRRKSAGTRAAVAAARIEELNAGTDLKRERIKKISKELGPQSAEAVAAKADLAAYQRMKTKKIEANVYPVPKPEELKNGGKGLAAGQVYTTPRGRLMWDGAKFIDPPKEVRAVPLAPAVAGADDDEDDEN
jgi:hypothetical protein